FDRSQELPIGFHDVVGQPNLARRPRAELEVWRPTLFDSHEQDGPAVIATHGFEVRSNHAGDLLDTLLHVAFGIGKRVAFLRGQHALDSGGRNLMQTVVIQNADARQANGGLSAQQAGAQKERQNLFHLRVRRASRAPRYACFSAIGPMMGSTILSPEYVL